MKVLFITSGNKTGQPGAVVFNQATSLIEKGIEVDFFLIKGRGILGYLGNITRLRDECREHNYSLFHAHGFSGFIATIARVKPLVVSLMGSEVLENPELIYVFRFFCRFCWSNTIVKTDSMLRNLVSKKNCRISVIPNGVNLSNNTVINKVEAQKNAGFDPSKKNVLFLADPLRKSKNFTLAKSAIDRLGDANIELHVMYNIPLEKVRYYINAADVLLLTSLWEGSPNVIKEAMACNCPIVSSNVGDVEWLFGNEQGHFLTGFDSNDVANKILLALEFAHKHRRTNGRQRIIELGIDSEAIARKIIVLYKKVLESSK